MASLPVKGRVTAVEKAVQEQIELEHAAAALPAQTLCVLLGGAWHDSVRSPATA
jgi:hypothetical protein